MPAGYKRAGYGGFGTVGDTRTAALCTEVGSCLHLMYRLDISALMNGR